MLKAAAIFALAAVAVGASYVAYTQNAKVLSNESESKAAESAINWVAAASSSFREPAASKAAR